MPRVQTYGGAQVAPVSTTGARFQAADFGASARAIGRGVDKLAGTLDAMSDEQAKTRADDLLLQYEAKARDIRTGLKSKQNADAVAGFTPARQQLDQLYGETLNAADPITKRALQDRLDKYHGLYNDDMAEYVSGQEKAYGLSVGKARLTNFAENAAAHWDKPELRTSFIADGQAQLRDVLRMQGITDPEIVKAEELKYVSSIHTGIVDNFLVNEDIDAAQAYLEANADAIDLGDELKLRQALKGPLQLRQSAVDAMSAAPGMTAAAPSSKAAGDRGMFGTILSIEGGTDAKGNFLTSPKGAVGPAQVMPGTAPEAARLAGLKWDEKRYRTDPEYNKALGEAYFKEQLRTFGDPDLAAAAYNAGPGAVEKALKKGGDWLSHLPAETQDYVAKFRKRGSGGAEQQARRWDKEGWYASIDAKADSEGWTFERRERAKEYADRQIARDEQLLARREDEADRQASEIILSRGAGFTDPSQIPTGVWSNMSARSRAAAMSAAEANRKSKEAKANGDTATSLELLRILKPDEFSNVNLGEYAHMMTPAELQQLRKDQATLKAGSDPINIAEAVSGAIGRYDTPDLWANDKKEAARQRVRIQRIMEADVRARTEGKRKPSDQDLYQAFVAATSVAQTYNKTFMGIQTGGTREVRRYDLTINDIPKATLDRIRKKVGAGATEEMVVSEYQAGKGRFW